MSLRTNACGVASQAHSVFGTTVILTGPDGIPSTYEDCIFNSNRTTISPDSGEEVVVFNPVASFPRSSLVTIPQNGEKWTVEAPLDPLLPDVTTVMSLDKNKSIEGGRSLNTIILYLNQVKQS